MKTIITVEDGKVTVEVDDKVYVELTATNPVVPVDKKPGEYIAVPENHESKADTPSPPQEPKNGVVSPPSTDSPETLPTGARTNSKQGSEKPRINKEPARNIWHIVVCRECTNDFKSKTGKAKYCPDCLKKRRNQLSLPAKRKPSPTPANGAWTPKAAVPKKERINGADIVTGKQIGRAHV